MGGGGRVGKNEKKRERKAQLRESKITRQAVHKDHCATHRLEENAAGSPQGPPRHAQGRERAPLAVHKDHRATRKSLKNTMCAKTQGTFFQAQILSAKGQDDAPRGGVDMLGSGRAAGRGGASTPGGPGAAHECGKNTTEIERNQRKLTDIETLRRNAKKGRRQESFQGDA